MALHSKQVVLSFLLGASLSALLLRPIPDAAASSHRPSTVWDGDFSPVIPPGSSNVNVGDVILGGPQVLDGFTCQNCIFEDTALAYGGGEFHLMGSTFSGKTTLTLFGAAQNTVALLEFLNSLEKGHNPEPVKPSVPAITVHKIPKPMTHVDIASPQVGAR
jgi:hypothetical protein